MLLVVVVVVGGGGLSSLLRYLLESWTLISMFEHHQNIQHWMGRVGSSRYVATLKKLIQSYSS